MSGDIEDAGKASWETRFRRESQVVMTTRPRPIPGSPTIYVKTYGLSSHKEPGCSHNVSDGEYMAGQLARFGYELTEDPNKADLWLLNSCTVKNPSEMRVWNMLEKAKKMYKKVVVAGCVPQGDSRHPGLDGVSLLGVQQIDRVVEVVEETLKGNTVRFLRQRTRPSLDLPKIRRNSFVEIVPISMGCLGKCTYCKTKHARGKLGSYEPDAIVRRVGDAVQEGIREVWLTSEDSGAYGRDIGTDLPSLLWKVVQVLDGTDVMLRLGMTNPPFILDHLDEIAQIFHHDNVYKFLHIPVQSGSDSVLLGMKREYTVAEFRHVVTFLQERVPHITLATDIICGFPGETEDDFVGTLRLIEDFRLPIVNISQFYSRPGTPAARMKKVPSETVKDRSRRVTSLFESYTCFEHLVGTTQRVLVTEMATDKKHLVGHTREYVQVLVDGDPSLLGTHVYVRIVKATKYSVLGQIVTHHPRHTDKNPLFSPWLALVLCICSVVAVWCVTTVI